jgi:hypothetical protein
MWNYSFKISIRFSQPLDGLIPFYFDESGSEYRSAYLAPAQGYVGRWVIDGKREGMASAPTGSTDERRNYYFRIRSRADKDGSVVSAYYGKIYGEFPGVTYYLNPNENDRNIEFDMSKNLFGKLEWDERAQMP